MNCTLLRLPGGILAAAPSVPPPVWRGRGQALSGPHSAQLGRHAAVCHVGSGCLADTEGKRRARRYDYS